MPATCRFYRLTGANWRKPGGHSSFLLTPRKGVAAEGEVRPFRVAPIVVFCIALLTPIVSVGSDAETEKVIRFEISRQRADQALIEFAEQADITFMFPFEEARGEMANPVVGSYTRNEAIEILLKGTDLSPEFDEHGAMAVRSARTSRGDTMSNRTEANIFASVAAMIVSIFTAQGAMGQETAPAASTAALEEVVVTSERRELSLQDVTASVRALTSQELVRLGADAIEDYASFVPGLNLIQQNAPGRTQIEMRGVTVGNMRDDRPEFRPTVGVYLDESPIAAQTVSANIALMDLERIEVMRGPQATLYGAGSLSGTIRMITVKPDLNESHGRVGASTSYTEDGGGNYDFNGVANLPLIRDELAMRALAFYRDEDGFIDNPVLGSNNINDNREIGGRLALRYRPKDSITVDASIGYQDNKIDSMFEYYEEAGDLNSQNAMPTPTNSDVTVASLVAELAFDVGTVTSATSYFSNDTNFYQDGSLFTDFITGIDDDFLVAFSTFFDLDEYTQEFRFVSNEDSRVNWIGGLLFQQQNHRFGQDMPVPGIDAVSGLPSEDFLSQPDNVYTSDVDIETTQLSLFGEASVTIDQLTFKAGLRWFHATQDSTVFFGGPLAFPNIGTSSADNSENGVNPTVNVSYQIDDYRMIYAQAARGFRLGGINQPIPEALCGDDLAAAGISDPQAAFDSDNLWSYEIGVKTSWLEDRLRINASGYLIDWEDPAYVVGFACGFSLIVNAGQFDISGFELDFETVIKEGLVSRLGLSYTDSELGEDVPLINGVKGDATPYSPQFSFSASLDYDFPIAGFAGYMGFIHGDVRWVDERITRFPGDPRESTGWGGLFNLDPYSEGNLRAGLYSDAWRFELFVKNLWDERPELSKRTWPYSEFPGTPIVTLRPRTFGIQMSRDF